MVMRLFSVREVVVRVSPVTSRSLAAVRLAASAVFTLPPDPPVKVKSRCVLPSTDHRVSTGGSA